MRISGATLRPMARTQKSVPLMCSDWTIDWAVNSQVVASQTATFVPTAAPRRCRRGERALSAENCAGLANLWYGTIPYLQIPIKRDVSCLCNHPKRSDRIALRRTETDFSLGLKDGSRLDGMTLKERAFHADLVCH